MIWIFSFENFKCAVLNWEWNSPKRRKQKSQNSTTKVCFLYHRKFIIVRMFIGLFFVARHNLGGGYNRSDVAAELREGRGLFSVEKFWDKNKINWVYNRADLLEVRSRDLRKIGRENETEKCGAEWCPYSATYKWPFPAGASIVESLSNYVDRYTALIR